MDIPQVDVKDLTQYPIHKISNLKQNVIEIIENGKTIFYILSIRAFQEIEEILFDVEIGKVIGNRLKDGKKPIRVNIKDLKT